MSLKPSPRIAVLAWMSLLALSACGQVGASGANGSDAAAAGDSPPTGVAIRATTVEVSVNNLGRLYPGEPSSASTARTPSRFEEWALPPAVDDPRSQTVLFGSFAEPRMDPARGDASLSRSPAEPGYLLITWNVPQVNASTGQVFRMTHISQYDGSGKFISSISQEANHAGTIEGDHLTEASVLAHSVPLESWTG